MNEQMTAMSMVNADVVQAALSNILEGLMDRTMMPMVRVSDAKQRIVLLMNQIDGQTTDRPDGSN